MVGIDGRRALRRDFSDAGFDIEIRGVGGGPGERDGLARVDRCRRRIERHRRLRRRRRGSWSRRGGCDFLFAAAHEQRAKTQSRAITEPPKTAMLHEMPPSASCEGLAGTPQMYFYRSRNRVDHCLLQTIDHVHLSTKPFKPLFRRPIRRLALPFESQLSRLAAIGQHRPDLSRPGARRFEHDMRPSGAQLGRSFRPASRVSSTSWWLTMSIT